MTGFHMKARAGESKSRLGEKGYVRLTPQAAYKRRKEQSHGSLIFFGGGLDLNV